MARSKWDELLPAYTTGGSRSDLLGRLVASTSGATGGSGTGPIAGAGVQTSSSDVTTQISSLTAQITNLSSIQQSQINALQDNTQAVTQNTTSKASGGSSIGSTVESAASSFLGGGLSSLSPLLGG